MVIFYFSSILSLNVIKKYEKTTKTTKTPKIPQNCIIECNNPSLISNAIHSPKVSCLINEVLPVLPPTNIQRVHI